MKHALLFVVGLSLMTSCSEAPKEVTVAETDEVTEKINDVVPNELMTAEIKGMSCEMACGGSIREGLIETGSVARVQFENFDMESEYNTAKIYFDKNKISAEKIAEIISKLNDKQFTIRKTETEPYSSTTSCIIEEETESSSSCCTETKNVSMQLPNLFDLLRSIVIN